MLKTIITKQVFYTIKWMYTKASKKTGSINVDHHHHHGVIKNIFYSPMSEPDIDK